MEQLAMATASAHDILLHALGQGVVARFNDLCLAPRYDGLYVCWAGDPDEVPDPEALVEGRNYDHRRAIVRLDIRDDGCLYIDKVSHRHAPDRPGWVSVAEQFRRIALTDQTIMVRLIDDIKAVIGDHPPGTISHLPASFRLSGE
jgi:hypothetical protein